MSSKQQSDIARFLNFLQYEHGELLRKQPVILALAVLVPISERKGRRLMPQNYRVKFLPTMESPS